jgi:hypothetical protein
MLADKVFGPATTTRNVYDTAAQHVVRGAMEGINGMFFVLCYEIFFLLVCKLTLNCVA